MNVTCQKCNASVPEEQAFCQNCGAPMAQGATPPPKRDDSWDMAATVIGQKIPMPAPPVSQPPAKPAGEARPAGRSTAATAPAPQPPPTPVHTPTPAPSHTARAAVAPSSTAKSNSTLYIILGVGAVLLLGILIIFLLMAVFS